MTDDTTSDRQAKDASPRAAYREAGEAMRAAAERLAAVPYEAKTAMYARITSWVIVQVGSYSRTVDSVSRKLVAERFGTSVTTVSRAMDWAMKHGVLDWRPGAPGRGWEVSLTPDHIKAQSGDTPLATSHKELATPPRHFTQGTGDLREDSEKITEKNPPTHSAERQAVTGLLNENWGGKGRIPTRHVDAVLAMQRHGWSWPDLVWLIGTNVESANYIAALSKRLDRVRKQGTDDFFTPEAARNDRTLLGMLGSLPKPSTRTPTRPGTIEEHGTISGRVDWGDPTWDQEEGA